MLSHGLKQGEDRLQARQMVHSPNLRGAKLRSTRACVPTSLTCAEEGLQSSVKAGVRVLECLGGTKWPVNYPGGVRLDRCTVLQVAEVLATAGANGIPRRMPKRSSDRKGPLGFRHGN